MKFKHLNIWNKNAKSHLHYASKIKIPNILHDLNFEVNLLPAYKRIQVNRIRDIHNFQAEQINLKQENIIDHRKAEGKGVCWHPYRKHLLCCAKKFKIHYSVTLFI